jgi:sterol desaturase/sphingolipid hydroxylase (fatty acid hydroxylase superfamily)
MLAAVHIGSYVAGTAVHGALARHVPVYDAHHTREYTLGSAVCVVTNLGLAAALEAWYQPHQALGWAPWTWWVVLLQLGIYVVTADLWFYYIHRLLHEIPSLYRHIHAGHHVQSHPTALEALNAHPLEHVVANLGSALCGVFLCAGMGLPQCWGGLVLWSGLATWSTCAAHSGVRTLVPGVLGTCERHDLHHRKLRGNYGQGTYWTDAWHGTLI